MISQEQTLGAELDQLGLIGASRNVRPLAALVVDRRHPAPFALEQVDLGAQAERFGSEPDGAFVNLWDFLVVMGVKFMEGVGIEMQRQAQQPSFSPMAVPAGAAA